MDDSIDKNKMSRRGFLGAAAAGLAAGLGVKRARAQETEEDPENPADSMRELGEESVTELIDSLVAFYHKIDPSIPNEKLSDEANEELIQIMDKFLRRHGLEAGVDLELTTLALQVNALVHVFDTVVNVPRENPLDPRIADRIGRLTKVASQRMADRSLVIPRFDNKLKMTPKDI